ncbi:hypothetical protein OXX59_008103 [Metschnikowia pulcherrima]
MGSIREAAKRLLINYSTAKSWVRKYEKDPTRLPDVGRSGGRSECHLDEEDKELVRQIVADCPYKQTSNVKKDLEDRMAELDIDQAAVKRFIEIQYAYWET